MGLFEFLIIAVIAVLACAAAIWVMAYLAPSHPPVIDKGLWILVVVILILILANAMGIFSHDVAIPRIR
jgi:hypothetical protein